MLRVYYGTAKLMEILKTVLYMMPEEDPWSKLLHSAPTLKYSKIVFLKIILDIFLDFFSSKLW